MRSLAQIEPRTPISAVPCTINTPGAYYLTTNLTCATSNAITIAVSGVTLNLGGFTIGSSVADAADGGAAILVNGGLDSITICNGHIRSGVTNSATGYSGPGFGYGIYCVSPSAGNIQVKSVTVVGVLYDGIRLNSSDSTLVESCTVRGAGSYGITAAAIKNCVVKSCGGTGIFCELVSDSFGESVYGGFGIYADCSAHNCVGTSYSSTGIYTGNAENCTGSSTTGSGIVASITENCTGSTGGSNSGINANTVVNCYGYSAGGYGLFALDSATGCYGYSPHGIGLYAFIANVCQGETTSGTALSTSHNVNSF